MIIPQYNIFKMSHVCPWWVAYAFDNPIRKLFYKPHQMLAPYLQEGMTAMDVGCGMGFFTIGMAKIVGDRGRVIALDLQSKMLEVTKKRSKRAGVANRITTQLCRPNELGVRDEVDFILAFWMVHEVPKKHEFFDQLISVLMPTGKLLIAEPKMHVKATDFQKTLETAQSVGLEPCGQPAIPFSRSALYKKSTMH